MDTTTVWIIVFGALATYMARIGGHLVLSRFQRVHPRIEAGLNAVPAAVLTTLVAPAATAGGPIEWVTLLVAGLVALRAGLTTMLAVGAIVLIVLRNVF